MQQTGHIQTVSSCIFTLWPFQIVELSLTFTTFWTNLANNKLIFFSFFPENRICHFVQIASIVFLQHQILVYTVCSGHVCVYLGKNPSHKYNTVLTFVWDLPSKGFCIWEIMTWKKKKNQDFTTIFKRKIIFADRDLTLLKTKGYLLPSSIL